MDSVAALFLIVFLIAMTVLPIIIGYARGVRNLGSIAVVTLLLGWTVLGWILALAWAMADTHPSTARQTYPNLY